MKPQCFCGFRGVPPIRPRGPEKFRPFELAGACWSPSLHLSECSLATRRGGEANGTCRAQYWVASIVGVQHVASMLGISIRILSRWDAAGIGPPKIKVGKLILFDIGKLTEWLASRETKPANVASRNTNRENHD